jgi:hypothetical protein
MIRDRAEKLGSLFLATFTTGLALLLEPQMGPMQRLWAVAAVAGSLALTVIVRRWPAPEPVKASRRG